MTKSGNSNFQLLPLSSLKSKCWRGTLINMGTDFVTTPALFINWISVCSLLFYFSFFASSISGILFHLQLLHCHLGITTRENYAMADALPSCQNSTVRIYGVNPYMDGVIFLKPLFCVISINFRMIRWQKLFIAGVNSLQYVLPFITVLDLK